MFQIQDVLIPARFICYILQVLLTISIGLGYKDFINSAIYATKDNNTKFQKDLETRFWALLSIFYLIELVEFIIFLSGYTLFINLLSLIQIFFHSITVLILNWFYRDAWESDKIYIPFILGGIIPGLLEICNLIILCSSNRTISKIK